VSTDGKYLAAAYLVVFVAVLIYVLLIAAKVQRLGGQVGGLVELAREPGDDAGAPLLACADRLRRGRLRVHLAALYAVGDVGRAHRLAAADGAARRPGRAHRRLPVGHLGRLAQPLRLARRRHVPDLGLPSALPAARPRGHAARSRAVPR